jgi:RHS repeat-associated protein
VINSAKQLRWRWDNVDPFGANLPNQNPAGLGAFGYNLRFPGQYFDSETGLHYNYFRDYNPSSGRYIESDPIGLAGGINTYGYVKGNPVSFVDTEGLQRGRLGRGEGDDARGRSDRSTGAKEKGSRTPAEEQQADGEHDWYKSVCETKPLPTGDKCQDLLNEANRAYMCADLMTQWDERWGLGRHAPDIAREFERFKILMERYKKCKNQCQ